MTMFAPTFLQRAPRPVTWLFAILFLVPDDPLDVLKQTGWSRSRFNPQSSSAVFSRRDANEKPQPRLAEFAESIRPVLERACFDCHGPDTQEANIRLDSLDPNLHTGGDVDWWSEVMAVISKGEMPPPDSLELSEPERQQLVDWLSVELQTASMVRRQSTSDSAFRRLTRYEYNHALQDLLGVPWDFAKDLPPDANSEEGFQNTSSLLHMSVGQFETYQRSARTALSRVIMTDSKPATWHWGITISDLARYEWPKQEAQITAVRETHRDNSEKLNIELQRLENEFSQPHARSYFRDLKTKRTAVAQWDYGDARYANAPSEQPRIMPTNLDQVAILPAGQWLNIELGNRLPDEGTLRVRVRASQADASTRGMPSLQLYFGWQATNEGRALLRVSRHDTIIHATSDAPQFYEWEIPLGEIYPRNSVRDTSPMGAIPSPSEYIRLVNSSASPGDICVDYVEVASPVVEQWPPLNHQRLLASTAPAENETGRAKEILKRFMRQAWRRPISASEHEQKLQLFQHIRRDCDSFEEAMIEVLATVLSAPQFLYLVQADATMPNTADAGVAIGRPALSASELASRLSFFLWCSVPDEELLKLADDGQLLDPQVMADQVERMLRDPRCERFAQHFVHQWLNLELLEFTDLAREEVNVEPLLKEAMQQEPVELFKEMIRENASVLDFIHADYTLLNERLARHYGIPDVDGNHFRRVSLPANLNRGGLLTQAGLLTMNSDFPDSHPLKRGKWLLVSLLNDPPPPPPPAVPQIDLANPEIAKMTLKERIEDHRNHAACMSCHAKIDPWGIAFENYDALGRWRDQINDRNVDASSELFNKQTLDGIEGLKRYLLENRQDQFVSAMVHKVATYALGRPLQFSDRADLEQIAAQVRQRGDGLRSLLVEIANSDLFRER
ncbi:MAG: DUF1592 domain-containing protein [Planctomycetaceae bacterium]|nr:DUF1592 domain-containing protein [Planctomycetaceae bacterium]